MKESEMYQSIITHNDFDGVVSAALCSHVFKVNKILFAGPSNIARADLMITPQDIVCDLPYPLDCGLWFDHHEGNLQELQYRNIEASAIAGKFDLQPSCARVILNYFLENNHRFPDYFSPLVEETDTIDSFNYHSVEDWRTETPGKIIDATIRSRIGDHHEKRTYLRNLAFWLRDNPIGEVVKKGDIQSRYQDYLNEEQEMMNLIKHNNYFLSIDSEKQIIVLDFTNFNRPGFVIKNLAYLLYPQSLAVLEVKNLFNRGIKSNDLAFSLSLSINLNHENHAKDAGEIMRELNIGDGHPGAAAGKITCHSKDEMLRQKRDTLNRIFKIWQEQV
jgi:oligoribonuclease NrnB/cAMP/cGMP phosphodiesterase (DHH superfamily)